MISGRVIVAWPLLVALLGIAGTGGFALTLGRSATGHRDDFIAGLLPLWRALACGVAVLSPLLLLAITATMASASWRQALPLISTVLSASHAGLIWKWRLPLTPLLVFTAFAPMRPLTQTCSIFAVSSALLLTEACTSHAVDIGAVAIAIYFTHQMAAALWLGAVFSLAWGAWREKLGVNWVEFAAPRVSRLAGRTVMVLILSGLFLTYHALLGDPARLLYALYGRTLLVKLAAASIVLLIGAYNRFVLMPNLGGAEARTGLLLNVASESLLLGLVIGLAALLANTPPAH